MRYFQKHCAHLVFDAEPRDSSEHLSLVKLNWLRIGDSIRVRKLYMIQKTINGVCPENFNKYVNLLKIGTRAQ